MLFATDAPAYLESAGLLDRTQIVNGPLAVRAAPGRAHNYLVETGPASGYFIKQRVPDDSRNYMANEASIWEMLQATSLSDILDHLPHLRHRDPDRGLLVFDLLPEAENLQQRLGRTGRFSGNLNRQLGSACGRLHRLNPEVLDPCARLPSEAPWILDIHQPGLPLLEYASSGNIQFVEEIQRRPELGDLLDGLRAEWRGTAIIHGDMKWANVLVSRSASGAAPPLMVIDWELGGRSDPLWDVAGILSNFLVVWLASIPVTGYAPVAVGLSQARYPLAMMQPAIGEFWSAYLSARNLGRDEVEDTVETVTRYTAARLLQWAYEYLQDQTAPRHLEMALLDLSYNLSQRPAEGALHLLGISATGVVSR